MAKKQRTAPLPTYAIGLDPVRNVTVFSSNANGPVSMPNLRRVAKNTRLNSQKTTILTRTSPLPELCQQRGSLPPPNVPLTMSFATTIIVLKPLPLFAVNLDTAQTYFGSSGPISSPVGKGNQHFTSLSCFPTRHLNGRPSILAVAEFSAMNDVAATIRRPPVSFR